MSQNNRAFRSNPNNYNTILKNILDSNISPMSQNNRAFRSNPNKKKTKNSRRSKESSQNNRAFRSNPNQQNGIFVRIIEKRSQNNRAFRSNPNSLKLERDGWRIESQNNRAFRSNPNSLANGRLTYWTITTMSHKITEPSAQIPTFKIKIYSLF